MSYCFGVCKIKLRTLPLFFKLLFYTNLYWKILQVLLCHKTAKQISKK